MITHSSILAWRIPWTEELGRLHTVHRVAKSPTRLSDFTSLSLFNLGSPGCSDSKESACSAGDLGLIPGSGRSSGEGNGNPPTPVFCLENLMDGRAWQATVHGVAKKHNWETSVSLSLFNHRASPVAQMVTNPPAMLGTWVRSLGWEEPLEEGLATHSSYPCLENPHGQDSLGAVVHRKEPDKTERLSTLALLIYLRSSSV